MTAPYDWAKDPGALAVQKVPDPPRPVGQLFPSRVLVPAVWLKRQPHLKRLVRCDYRHGALQVQWRFPERGDIRRIFFRRN